MQRFTPSTEFQLMVSHLHRGGNFGYYHILPDRESYWWSAGQPEDINVNPNDHLYFGVHPTTKIPPENADGKPTQPIYVRAQRKYIAAVNCLIAEFDTKRFGKDLKHIFSHIATIPFPPSIEILSGGGVHAYWLIRNPFIISNEKSRKYISHIHREWSVLVKGDASKDITRVLRVPGSFNPKYNPPELAMFFKYRLDIMYDLDDLSSILPPQFDPPSSHTLSDGVIGYTGSGSDPIGEYNSQVNVADLLQRYGYKWHGHTKMLSPHSTTGSAGVTVDEKKNRAFCHHESDPLGTGYWNKPFDVLKLLEFNGNFSMALDAIRGSI